MLFPPNAFLLGAQKAGTTTLAYLLSQHPDVCVSNPKEPHFFTRNWHKGLTWYQERFSNHNAICLDASVTNTQALLSDNPNSSNAAKCLQGIPKRVYNFNPHAKFIYLLREPVERTYSAYWWRVNLDFERNSFAEAIQKDSVYLDTSNYYGQIRLWLEYFPIDSFLFVLFDDLKKNPEYVAKKCFHFLGADPDNCQINLEVKNKTIRYNAFGRWVYKFIHKLNRANKRYLVPPTVKKVLPLITTNYQGIPPILEKDRVWLQEYFSEKNRSFEIVTGFSLDRWQPIVQSCDSNELSLSVKPTQQAVPADRLTV
ncbi:sulfotransferase domain-containing protein [Gloeocapsopsis crepidinum LEGE 06123]|uniref:Sulfotransferase domain-containing protein n=1 Tax=Gloeocapsopsis crepidinum LEGE 06123 TaxID=588587 RepID=A0ABR9V1F0_9CHRO|nr:sulfotransferase domain-containing protein [Gloeocapsopsis crepidinum]MBE9193630.1 sulfotransferase domain-containing protein [Gloeocapsopsis crepidinum LEGE 06123]